MFWVLWEVYDNSQTILIKSFFRLITEVDLFHPLDWTRTKLSFVYQHLDDLMSNEDREITTLRYRRIEH